MRQNQAVKWHDLVVAVPAVGVRLAPDFGRLTSRVESLGKLWTELHTKAPLNLSWPNPTTVDVRCQGWRYTLTAMDFVVQFSYELELRREEKQVPFYNAAGELRRYSELLEECIARTKAAMALVLADHDAGVQRLGFVLNTQFLLDEELPPGVEGFIDHIGRPWKSTGGLVKANGELLMQLTEDDGHVDRAFHNLVFDKTGDDSLLGFKLDWQRYWKEPMQISAGEFPGLVDVGAGKAQEYFVAAGEGIYDEQG